MLESSEAAARPSSIPSAVHRDTDAGRPLGNWLGRERNR
jgi:hypothetical protein